MAQLRVRTAVLADLTALHAVAGRAVRELLGGFFTPAQLRIAAEVGVYEVEPELIEAGTYWVAEIDGVVVAGSGWSAGGSLRPDAAAGGPCVTDPATAAMRATYVEPRWARHGLATLLARTTETAARIAGFTRFEALCTPPSEAMRRNLGYHLVERVEAKLGDVTAICVAHMRKDPVA